MGSSHRPLYLEGLSDLGRESPHRSSRWHEGAEAAQHCVSGQGALSPGTRQRAQHEAEMALTRNPPACSTPWVHQRTGCQGPGLSTGNCLLPGVLRGPGGWEGPPSSSRGWTPVETPALVRKTFQEFCAFAGFRGLCLCPPGPPFLAYCNPITHLWPEVSPCTPIPRPVGNGHGLMVRKWTRNSSSPGCTPL